MATDQKHPSDSTHSEQGVIYPPSTEKIAQLNTEVRNRVFSITEELKKQLEDCHPQYNTLEKRVKRLERNVKFLETETEDLDECVDRETVVDLIHEIVPSLISRRGLKGNRNFSYTIETDTSEESDSGEIVEESHGYQVREKKAVPYALATLAKQRRRVRPRKVKRFVV
ncbi:hypothetical protein RhiirA5_426880 [Rhizophagus irregularis]|uniref:Uncharacterized protein n=1 Tax=Rhizophagus irregularis TaxID=588596 RepID=A0A2N0P3C8_9GLOM|nr:hypothetical protein RhiirA5_426880 [Rhizophagus irregularis]